MVMKETVLHEGENKRESYSQNSPEQVFRSWIGRVNVQRLLKGAAEKSEKAEKCGVSASKGREGIKKCRAIASVQSCGEVSKDEG